MTLRELLRDCLARIVAAREEFDGLIREQILEDLEADLAGYLAHLDDQPRPMLERVQKRVATAENDRRAA